MEWLFGRRKTPQEMLKQNQRALNKAMRELDRENNRLEVQEKKIIADIKKSAKANQMVNFNFPYINQFLYLGFSQSNGKGFGENSTISQKIRRDARQYSSSFTQSSRPQKSRCYGAGKK